MFLKYELVIGYTKFVFSRKPVACGVTSLGMDHVSTLGGTLESIAWQKAGIFKVLTDDQI